MECTELVGASYELLTWVWSGVLVLINWLVGRLEDLLFYKMKIVEHNWNFVQSFGKYHSLVLLLSSSSILGSVTISSRDTIEMENL